MQVGSIYIMDMLSEGKIYVTRWAGGDDVRCLHATWNSIQFKIYELFIFRIFYLIPLDNG